MDITWYGLSCFRLREANTVVLCDPFTKKVGSMPKVRADIVTLSTIGNGTKNGEDHSKLASGDPMVFGGPGEYETSNVFISGMSNYQTLPDGSDDGRNIAYFFEMGEFTVAHLGALEKVPKQSQFEALKVSEVDILMVPVGGGVMLDPTRAVEIVGMLEPRLVIPMYYQESGYAAKWVDDLEPVDRFLKELGLSEPEAQSTLKVSKTGLPEETQVVLLEKTS